MSMIDDVCCSLHSKSTEWIQSLDPNRKFVLILPDFNNVAIPAYLLARTSGLANFMLRFPNGTIAFPAPQICILNQVGCCKLKLFCKHIHICRDFFSTLLKNYQSLNYLSNRIIRLQLRNNKIDEIIPQNEIRDYLSISDIDSNSSDDNITIETTSIIEIKKRGKHPYALSPSNSSDNISINTSNTTEFYNSQQFDISPSNSCDDISNEISNITQGTNTFHHLSPLTKSKLEQQQQQQQYDCGLSPLTRIYSKLGRILDGKPIPSNPVAVMHQLLLAKAKQDKSKTQTEE